MYIFNCTSLTCVKSTGYNNYPDAHAHVGGVRVRVHRLVMELWLGRALESTEVVHHRDGNKLHNCPPNLELTTLDAHSWQHRRTLPLVGYCVQCGEPFLQRRDDGKPQRFCRHQCWTQFAYERNRQGFKTVEWLLTRRPRRGHGVRQV